MTIECGHIKSHWDNHDRCIKCSSCSRESACSTCSSWSDKTWKLAEERRTYTSRNWSWLRRRDCRKPCLIYQTKKNWMGSPPHMALLPGGGPIQVATPRVLVPRGVLAPATCQPATGHLPNGQEDITDWPPVIGYRSKGHYTRIFKSVNHRSAAIRSPVIGLGKYQHRGKSIDFISIYIL